MRRLLICVVMLASVFAVPTAAGANERDQPSPTGPLDAPDVDARPADTVEPVDVKPAPDRARPDRPKPDREALRLECAGSLNDAGEAAVACNWSEANGPTAAAYVLYRGNIDQRVAIFRTDSLANTRFLDVDIEVGVRYRYKVVVLDANGNKVGSSRATTAGVAAPEPEVEALELACEAIAVGDSDAQGAKCRWSAASTRSAVGYQLWRAVDRDARELVWRGGLDVTSYADRLPAAAQMANYAILAVDAEGKIVARSRAVQVRFEHDRPGTTDERKPTGVSDKALDVLTPTDLATDAPQRATYARPDWVRQVARTLSDRLLAILRIF